MKSDQPCSQRARRDPEHHERVGSDCSPPGIALTVLACPEQVPRLRSAARDFAELHGVPGIDDVALAVSEAATNAIVHAYPGSTGGLVQLTATRAPTTVTFLVEDHGCGRQAPTANPGLGLGLQLMARLTERLAIKDRPGGGTSVQLTFPAAGSHDDTPAAPGQHSTAAGR